ncbi:MAG: ATP-dependent Clp protease ATP-binding subunit [Bacteroidales bacterium]|nr:ATP-dependent Clp protease ATP-binding subunit [Bacteroidales bacterium]
MKYKELNENANLIIEKATDLAKSEGMSKVTTSCVALIMIADNSDIVDKILSDYGIDKFSFFECNNENIHQSPQFEEHGLITMDSKLQNIIEECVARVASCDVDSDYVTSEAIFREIVKDYLGPETTSKADQDPTAIAETKASNSNKSSVLPKNVKDFCVDLTDLAKNGKISPIIGREYEIRLIETALLRKDKNNPIIVAEQGVGKTALVKGLAAKIASGDVPAMLKNKHILMFNSKSFAQHSGAFGKLEEIFNDIVSFLKSNREMIPFLDDTRSLFEIPYSSGSNLSDAVNGAISGGEIRMIGSMTGKEYNKYVSADPSFESLVQKIEINELSTDDTIGVLDVLKPSYEAHHNLRIDDSAIEAAVNLSSRYIGDKHQPDKSIDIIDLTSARVSMKGTSDTVTESDVREIISEITGIPVNHFGTSERQRLRDLDKKIRERVFGQDKAVSALCHSIIRNAAEFTEHKRPIGSFLFIGPTGVGKTELAKALSADLMGSEDNLIRIDMSEYGEAFSVSRLFGAPPGYVGYEQGGQLTEAVRRKPYSVILLDEVEKAHPSIFDTLLQVLDDGRMTDGQGRTVDFKNCIIIMTSNLCSSSRSKVGFGQSTGSLNEESSIQQVKSFFRPEFINRLDAVINFNALPREVLLRIADKLLTELSDRLLKKGYIISFDSSVSEFVVDSDNNTEYGARPIRRVVETKVIDEITNKILFEEITTAEAIIVKEVDGNIVFEHIQ